MAFSDLSELVALLERRGHLRRIRMRVNPELETTDKLPEEGYAREWTDLIQMSSEVKARVDEMWKGLGL